MAALDPSMASTAPASEPRPAPDLVPARARGVELLGEVSGSGYRRAPSLVRRADGQMLQLTPVLYAVLEAIDGHRDVQALAVHLRRAHRVEIDPEDLAQLVEQKLRPLGVLRGVDGAEPEVERSNPLLALRWRYVISDPDRTARLARPFTALFGRAAVALVLLAFALSTGWLLFVEGLAGATRDALYRPGLLLAVIALTAVSAGFHELGHAAAALRGGARPGAMGAGLYLIWPAFYTDVSDSYRLPRPDRLRVDLGGLYFNAVFSVAVVAVALATGAEALLVIVPLQLLQMLRQLVPLVRFDGYHVLADLTGVPDLFARIKPTLAGLLPWRWGDPAAKALRPWARFVVTAWVLAVVPLLALSFVLLVVSAPRILATVWDSIGQQAAAFGRMWSAARPVNALLALVSIVVVALPALGIVHLLARLTRRTARRLWRASEGNPAKRAAVVAGGLLLVALLARAWWPDDRYEPIREDERGTILDGFQTLAAVTPLPEGEVEGTDAEAPEPFHDDGHAEAIAWRTAATRSPVAPVSTAERPRFAFTPPDAPGPGDNQALVVNYEDGSSQAAYAPSLDWVTDGSPVHSANQAYALASCVDCRSVAVAFQVVLIVGSNDEIVPRNEAVAVNHTCSACTTRALALQTVLVLDDAPSDATMAELEALWARVEAVRSQVGPQPLAEVRSQLLALQAELIELLGADIATRDADSDADDTPATDLDGDGEVTDDSTAPSSEANPSTEADGSSGSAADGSSTTDGAGTATTATTAEPDGGGTASTSTTTSTTEPAQTTSTTEPAAPPP
ncbi:MAG: hypothetical protein ACO1PW_05735 [Actinomycetota bacterium]